MPTSPESNNVRIQYEDPNKYRDIDKDLLKNSIQTAIESGIHPALAQILPIITILEGNGTPYGVLKGQDISARRATPALLQKLGDLTPYKVAGNRLATDNMPKDVAQALLLNDKFQKLSANGMDNSVENTAQHFRDPRIPNTKYSEEINNTIQNILNHPANVDIRTMLEPLFKQKK